MKNIEKNNNFIEEREVVADVRRSGPRLSRRFLKRVLSLLLALYLLVNSCAFASVRSTFSQLALRATSFIPIRPMVEKWFSKLPR